MQITLPAISSLSRSQEGIDLSGEDGDAYGPAMEQARAAIRDLNRYIAEAEALQAHTHNWDCETGFCGVCGADGNA